MRQVRRISVVLVALAVMPAAKAARGHERVKSLGEALELAALASARGANLDCPIIISDGVVTVAPDQPVVEPRATVGIINALCAVTLDIVGCNFSPTSVVINCDANGDGVPELAIPLTHVTQINTLLTQATLAPLTPLLPGTAFPLACCGGSATITLSRTVTEGDDNVFGTFTQTQVCPIELGIRAPVIISAAPASGNCRVGQNILLPGSCFVLPGGTPNVRSVFAVERGNTDNVVQATKFVILNSNLIDALFDFGADNVGKTFLIFASGPNGTSRNMTVLPAGAPADCSIGNEQGVQVTFDCQTQTSPPGGTPTEPPPSFSCSLGRNSSGAFTLTLAGTRPFRHGSTVRVGGATPKKTTFKGEVQPGLFSRIVLKGKFCAGLPGNVVVTDPTGVPSLPFLCAEVCNR